MGTQIRPRPLNRHEVDRFGGCVLCGHDEIAFVLAIFVVDHDDHSGGADAFDGALDGCGGFGWDGVDLHGWTGFTGLGFGVCFVDVLAGHPPLSLRSRAPFAERKGRSPSP